MWKIYLDYVRISDLAFNRESNSHKMKKVHIVDSIKFHPVQQIQKDIKQFEVINCTNWHYNTVCFEMGLVRFKDQSQIMPRRIIPSPV